MKRVWWQRLLVAALSLTVIAAAALFGASSVQTWMDQNDQRADAEALAVELDARVAELEAEIERRTSSNGARREALCFGPYVEPGTEVYSVMGLHGCVTSPAEP